MEDLDRKEEFDAYLITANYLMEAAKTIMQFNGLYGTTLLNQAQLLLHIVNPDASKCEGGSCGTNQMVEISEEVKNDVDALLEELKSEIGDL